MAVHWFVQREGPESRLSRIAHAVHRSVPSHRQAQCHAKVFAGSQSDTGRETLGREANAGRPAFGTQTNTGRPAFGTQTNTGQEYACRHSLIDVINHVVTMARFDRLFAYASICARSNFAFHKTCDMTRLTWTRICHRS